jgi:transitional endoplasmic reticulum ATPase
MAKATTATTVSSVPDFITAINNDYRSQIAHVFAVHGNIYDFCDNTGKDLTVKQVFSAAYDDNFQKEVSEEAARDRKTTGLAAASQNVAPVTRILVTYDLSHGLEFSHPASMMAMQSIMKEKLGEMVTEKFMAPVGVGKLIEFMNLWFKIAKERAKTNFMLKDEKKPLLPELLVTWVLRHADAIFPTGDLAQIGPDRNPIVSIREWAEDEWLGYKNRIIMMTRHISDLHPSIRSEISSIHLIRKPNLEDRLDYIQGFDNIVKKRAAAAPGGKLAVSDNTSVTGIMWADDFDATQCSVQSAGMNRKQLKDVFLQSWISQIPVDFSGILRRKQRALQDEYQGMLDFKEPTFGFEEIGGQEHFKQYCFERIITPLRQRDLKTCSRGAIMLGPPGTGKSMLALALAKEAKMNFMVVDLGKVFAGLVGQTEKNMRQLLEAIEAASPCIVFADEVDSVLSAGRSSGGDSGTSGRVFNSFMTFLSDPSRVGRVVVLLASNRPDLLDAALIRDGRVDAKIPILPPAKGDSKGRTAVLTALKTKHKVAFHRELASTMKNPDDGLGRLLLDTKRIWTGAEIESLIRKAISRAAFANRVDDAGVKDYTIQAADWNHAMDVIIPNTGDVEMQISLALRYVNDLDYCPTDYWDQVKIEQENYAEEQAQRRAA